MEGNIQGGEENVGYPYPMEDERSKVTMVFKRKNNNSHGDANVRQKLNSDDSGDESQYYRSGGEDNKAKRSDLQRRLSTDVVSRDKSADGSASPKTTSENVSTITYPTLVPFCLPKDSADTDKYEDIIKASDSELRDIRLTKLSSERDRSISVDRSSSSSQEEVAVKKIASDKVEHESAAKRLTETKEKEAKDTRRRETNEDGRNTLSKLPASRSTSRSPSKHRRRESPRRDRHRSRDRHRDRSPRRSPRKRRSRSQSPKRHSRERRRSKSRGQRSRSRGYRSRSRDRHGGSRYRRRSRSYERRRYRDRSSSRDGYRKRRKSRSSSRSRSRGRSAHERSKGRLTGLDKVASLTLSSASGPMTPQMALQQTMAAMSAKAQALTGIELPKYYNPAAVNPLKYAEQVQKRKLLWETKKETTQEQPKNSVWDKLTFQQDQDGKMTEKFRKLMGIKSGGGAVEETKDATATEVRPEVGTLQNQEELFRNLDQQYEMARMSTHTHRGVGLGYSSQAIFPPLQKP